jgi:hypothetical protein
MTSSCHRYLGLHIGLVPICLNLIEFWFVLLGPFVVYVPAI